jgi:hypothetical protein
MLALITAGLVSRELFGKGPVFLELMRARGLDYLGTPLTQTLRRIGVASEMNRQVETLPHTCERELIEAALANEPDWIIILQDATPVSLMPAADLARHIQEAESADETAIKLLEIPATRLEFAGIDFQATLHEALEVLNETKKEVLYVTRHTIPGIKRIHGVLTRETIDKSYHV